MDLSTAIAAGLIGLVAGVIAGIFLRKAIYERDIENAHRQAQRIIAEAQKEAQTRRREAVIEAREQLAEEKKAFDKEAKETRQELIQLEKQLANLEDTLDRRSSQYDEKEKEIEKRTRQIESRTKALDLQEEELKKLLEKERAQLENIAGITEAQARELLLENLDKEMQREQALVINRYVEETKETCKRRARDILVSTIQRIASEEVSETTISTVPLPSDDMKG
ncbi:MAG: DUF3552 domain-containing protein, partial [Candidatus Omnitrophica bacterium]|nr:DUF3552 domain-containing protein [Candidatus Omnitrophota bacterium]